tara:strand:- start:1286 stop:2509 length:1224 start_codon:yes stop_codon:yes gene_type:complete
MTVYFYQATDRSGKLIEGDIEADDYKFAVRKIRSLNYLPIKISKKTAAKSFSLDLKLPDFKLRRPITAKQLVVLTHQLATLVSSGLTLDKSLLILMKLTEKPKAREILADVQRRVHGGSTLADALAQYPNVFSKLYVNMIRAGEAGGVLGTVLVRLADFLEKNQNLKDNIRSASIYPVILFSVGILAVVVLMTVVIPKFAKVFEGIGELPLPTVLLLGLSEMLAQYWWAALLLMVGSILSLKIAMQNERTKRKLDALIIKTPLFGPLIQKIQVSRFSLTMATLLKSGVPILQSLFIVRSILTNLVIADAMETLHKGLKGGKGISTPLQKLAVFPPMAIHMITVGEETGNLENMLGKVATTYDREVENSIKNLISLIEPFMILLMGLVIGFIVVSMLLAIFSINDVPL